MKICHMTSVHNRYDVRIFHKECKTLASNGYDTTLVVNDREKNEVCSGVNIVSTGYRPSSKIKRIIISQKLFLQKALEIDAEIYHFHDPELLPVAMKIRNKGKKVIFDSHEYYYEQIKQKNSIPKIMRNLIANLYLIYESYTFKKIEAVIFPCTLNSSKHPEKNAVQRIVYINNVPKLDEFYDKYTVNEHNKTFSICHVGSLSYNRGIVHLIKATKQTGVSLILAGKFNPDGLLEEIKNMPDYKFVDYRGYVSRTEVLNIYKESKVGISTLLNRGQYLLTDNLSTKIYEYMSMGLPVIMSNTPYVQSVLKDYNFGIAVNPEDINEISDAIVYLKNNPDIAKIMGENGRKAIKEKYNWSIEEKKLLDLYKNL